MAKRNFTPSHSKSSKTFVLFMFFLVFLTTALTVILQKDSARAVVPQTVVVAEYDTVDLPVPVRLVPAGTKADEILLKKVAFPKHQIPGEAIQEIGSLSGQYAVSDLPAGLPLFANNFSRHAAINPVIKNIPEGMRAMTIKVDAISAVEGWAGSGAIVDLLLVEKDRTTVVAENVKILSAERSVAPVEGQASPNIPSTVTLLVTQEQCLKINTAIVRGKIAFALRNFSDAHNWEQTIFTADKLSKANSPKAPQAYVNGYIEVQQTDGMDRFTLSDGKWLKTPSKPQGFFVGEK